MRKIKKIINSKLLNAIETNKRFSLISLPPQYRVGRQRSFNPIYEQFFSEKSFLSPKTLFTGSSPFSHIFRQQMFVRNYLESREISSNIIIRGRNDNQVPTLSYNQLFDTYLESKNIIKPSFGGANYHYLTLQNVKGINQSPSVKKKLLKSQKRIQPVVANMLRLYQSCF